MTSFSESTFGDIQMNERYKRLKRNLKMSMMKEMPKQNINNGIDGSPAWLNLSSINGDNLDTSSTAMSLYSKNGSEVVASSNNMRKMLLHQNQKKFPFTNSNGSNNPATNSANQFSLPQDTKSRELMPPPKSIGILAHSSRRNSPSSTVKLQRNEQVNTATIESHHKRSLSSLYSSIKCPSSTNPHNTSQILYESEPTREKFENNIPFSEKPDRIFSKWRVMLNVKGQLIIKGTLECGKVARSKPVIRRLSSISVQSIFNHIYNLNGSIYDERSELPDYVRDKFFNGFPDDWENVYQVWRNFITGGSSLNFRWPTAITDSDDDLQSGITEITVTENIGKKLPVLHSESLKNRNCMENPAQYSSTRDRTLPNEEKLNCSQCHCSTTNSTRSELIKTPDNRSKLADDERININDITPNKIVHQDLNISNSTVPSNIPNINMASLKDVLPADELNIIRENLDNRNCSIDYIDKIIHRYNSYRTLMLYKLEDDEESVKSKITTQPSVDNTGQTNKSLPQDNYEYNSKRIANVSSDMNRKRKIRRSMRDSNDSDSYGDDSDYDESNRSRRNQRSPDKRKFYRRTSIGGKLSRRRAKTPDSDDDDYIPKKIDSLKIPAGSELRNPIINTKTPVLQQINGTIHRANNPQNVASYSQFAAHQLEQKKAEQMKINRNDRESSMSTIGAFLKNYASSVSITEDESNNDTRYKPFEPNINRGENKINRRNYLDNQQKSRSKYQYYDSSVSITEDEFNEAHKGIRNEFKKQTLQDKITPQIIKRTTTDLKHLPSTSQSYDRRNLLNSLSNVCETDGKIHDIHSREKQEFSADNQNKIPILNDNKENRSIDTSGNRNIKNWSHTNPRELEVSENIKSKQTEEEKFISPERKRKPTVVSVESVSINSSPQLLKKSQSQYLVSSRLDSSKEGVNVPTVTEPLRPTKSLDDRKRKESGAENLLLNTDQKTMAKSKNLNIKLQDTDEITKNKQPVEVNNEVGKHEKAVYGSEKNPKRLTAWVPKVLQTSDSDNGLVFEGKLLNEADLVAIRKFTTDFVCARISRKVFKTETNEFYQLVGDLTDTKHSLPKELQKLCMNGCPTSIPQFCKKWKELKLDNSNSSGTLLNVSKDIQNMPVSSRGRRILPPLCYWTGERVTLKDNQAVYDFGNSRDSSILAPDGSLRDESQNSSKSKDTSAKDTTNSVRKNSSIQSKEKISNESKENEKNPDSNLKQRVSTRKLPTKRTRNSGELKDQQQRQGTSKIKRRLTRKLSSPHSSDSDYKPKGQLKTDFANLNSENEERKPNTRRRSSRKLAHASSKHPVDSNENKSSGRQKIDTENKVQSSSNVLGTLTISYKKRIDRQSDLSDDKISNF